jgi:hypothetical protein
MARPLARDKAGVLNTYDPELGKWRPVTPEEAGELRPRGVLDEQGVTNTERWTIKNLAANPAAAKALLELKGYQAVQYGDGLNFAVRKSPDEPWRLVDPAKGGWTEVFKDLVDLLGDVGVGTATALGTVAGGGIASALTGAASGATAEGARELLGSAAGIPGNVSPGAIAASGVVGGIAPGVGKLVGKAARGVAGGIIKASKPGGLASRAGEQFAQRAGGIRGGVNLEISDVVEAGIAAKGRPFVDPDSAVGLMRQHIDEIANKQIDFNSKLLEKLIPKKATVNLVPFKKELGVLTDVLHPSKIAKGLDPTDAARLQQRFADLLRRPSRAAIAADLRAKAATQTFGSLTPGGSVTNAQITAAYKNAMRAWNAKLRSVDAKIVWRAKQLLQEAIADARGFRSVGAATPGAVAPAATRDISLMAKFSRKLTQRFHNSVPKAIQSKDLQISADIQARNVFRKFFGEDIKGGVSNLLKAHKPGGESVRRALQAYDKRFPGLGFFAMSKGYGKLPGGIQRVLPGTADFPGTGAEELARQVNIGKVFTSDVGRPEEYGVPGVFGKFLGGVPVGSSLLGPALGGLGGFAVGGPMGALTGAALAPLAFSPAAMIKAAPFTMRANAFVSRMATGVDKVLATKLLREATYVLGSSAGLATGRRIASEDSKGRRRTVFIGQ